MEFLGTINDKKVYFINVLEESEWANELPYDNWIALISVSSDEPTLIERIAKACVDHHSFQNYCTGNTSDEMGLAITAEAEKRAQGKTSGSDWIFDQEVMVSAFDTFEECLWYTLHFSDDHERKFKTIVHIDNLGLKDRMLELMRRINSGEEFFPTTN